MKTNLIEGVKIKKLKMIPDERGYLMEIMRYDDEQFQKFGQTYISACYPQVIKAWHYHKKQTDNFCVVSGMMKVVLYDSRSGPTYGKINEFFVGELNPMLITIPTEIVHGMTAIGGKPALLLNTPDLAYNHDNPDEFRIPPFNNNIPYNWELVHG